MHYTMKYAIILFTSLITSQVGFSQNKTLPFLDKAFPGTDANNPFAFVAIFFDGNIQGLASNSEKSNQSSATGSIGISVIKNNSIWAASINIASTNDTLSAGFNNLILTPQAGKSLTSGILEYQLLHSFDFIGKFPFGIHGYGSSSSSQWLISDTVVRSTVLGLGVTLVHTIIRSTSEDNSVYLGFELGPTYRGVFGDISNKGSLFEKALGSKSRNYFGFESGLKIQFNKITAGLQGFWLFDPKGNKLDGITSYQMTGGITITGAFYQGKFKL